MLKQFLFCIGWMALAGCQEKSGSDEIPEGIYMEHLSMHSWQLSRVTVQELPGTQEADITNTTRDNCEKDDLIRFSSTGSFQYSENNTACTGSGKSVFRSLDGAPWTYSATDSSLLVVAGFNRQRFQLFQLNPQKMHLFQTGVDYFGKEARYHFYFDAK